MRAALLSKLLPLNQVFINVCFNERVEPPVGADGIAVTEEHLDLRGCARPEACTAPRHTLLHRALPPRRALVRPHHPLLH
jgi:hypothetical protein